MIEQVEKLEDVLEPYAGQSVYCAADKKYYRWDPVEGWQEAPANLTLNSYELNKQIIGQLETLGKDELAEKRELIANFKRECNAQFYMLLCRDINYFTVFQVVEKDADDILQDAVIECAKVIGQIKAIDLTEGKDAIELWMTYEEETYVAYFFPYDSGVIACV